MRKRDWVLKERQMLTTHMRDLLNLFMNGKDKIKKLIIIWVGLKL